MRGGKLPAEVGGIAGAVRIAVDRDQRQPEGRHDRRKMQEASGNEPCFRQSATLNEYLPFTRWVSAVTTTHLTV